MWRQKIIYNVLKADYIYCYPRKQKKHFLSSVRTVDLTLFKCVYQATGTEKTESNYEEENKLLNIDKKYLMKVIVKFVMKSVENE